MSSAFLYLAIVAIWALVLVPNWLRNKHPAETDLDPELADDETATAQVPDAPPHPAEAAASHGTARTAAADPAPPSRSAGTRASAARVTQAPATAQRSRVLAARRRTLIMLVLLTAGTIAIAFAHLAASWISVPPAALLVFFLLLLRTAARIDAQRAYEAYLRTRDANPTSESGPAATEAPTTAVESPAAATPGTAGTAEPGAEIIDISARVDDQPYDQYLDAQSRAVGD